MENNFHALDSIAAEPAEKKVFLDVFRVVHRRKWFIGFCLIAGLVAAGIYCQVRGPEYESRAQILVIKKRLETAPLTNPELAPPAEDYLASHQVVITSPQILGDAIQKNHLQDLPCFAGEAKVLKRITNDLAVDRVFKIRGGAPPSNILNVYYSARNPEDARAVLQAVVESYQNFLKETYRNVNAEALDLISKAKEVLHKEIADKEAAYLKFRQSTPLTWKGKAGGNVQLERLYNIDAKRSVLRMRQVELQSSLAAIDNGLKNGKPMADILEIVAGLPTTQDIISPGLLSAKEPWQSGRSVRTTLQEELVNLQFHEAKLLDSFGPNHPQVVAVQQRLDMVRGMITPSAGNAASEQNLKQLVDMKAQLLRQDLNEIQRAEQSLEKLFEREQEEAKATGINEALEEFYRKAIERSQLLYESIINRLQQIDTVKDFGGYNTQVIAQPENGLWAWKKDVLFLVVGTCAGLMLGFGGGWLLEVRNRTFRTPREICRDLRVSGVSHIPYFKPAGQASQQTSRGARGLRSPLAPREASRMPSALDAMLCTYHQADSRQAEAYRALRTALYFQNNAGQQKVLQVTGLEAGDGATTLAANLAVSMAQSGKRILLIDADFRGPRLHQVLGLTNHLGLSTLVAGQAEVAQAIQSSAVHGLDLLPSGPTPTNSAELLASQQFQDFLDEARQRYDYVLIDSPSLWSVTDPSVLAPRVDGLILTLRISKNGAARAQGAKNMLDRLGARVASVVVNAVKRYPQNGSPSLAHYPDDAEY